MPGGTSAGPPGIIAPPLNGGSKSRISKQQTKAGHWSPAKRDAACRAGKPDSGLGFQSIMTEKMCRAPVSSGGAADAFIAGRDAGIHSESATVTQVVAHATIMVSVTSVREVAR